MSLCAVMVDDGSACGEPARIYTARSGKTYTLCDEHYHWFLAYGANWEPSPEELAEPS